MISQQSATLRDLGLLFDQVLCQNSKRTIVHAQNQFRIKLGQENADLGPKGSNSTDTYSLTVRLICDCVRRRTQSYTRPLTSPLIHLLHRPSPHHLPFSTCFCRSYHSLHQIHSLTRHRTSAWHKALQLSFALYRTTHQEAPW